MLELGELGRNLQQVWQDPAFWAAGAVVLVYAFLRFSQRPTGQGAPFYEDTDPVAPSRAFTTAFRYRSLQFLYVGIYALAYAAIVIIASVPALRAIAAETLKIWSDSQTLAPETGITITTWAATLLSVLLPQAPVLQRIDNLTRSAMHKAAAIPLKAQELSREMREGAFRFTRNEMLRELGRTFPSPQVLDMALKAPDSPLYAFARLQYLQIAIRKLGDRDTKFRAFVNNHRANIDPIFARLNDLNEQVLAGPLAPTFDPYSGRAVKNTAFDASVDKLVRQSLDDAFARLTRFLACALLQSSLTEESAYDQIEWLGFARPRRERRIDVMTLVYAYLITFAATTGTSTVMWLIVRRLCAGAPAAEDGICAVNAAVLSFDRFVFWGVWGGAIHMLAILCALVVRFTWGLHGASRWRYGSVAEHRALAYIIVGALSWATGNAISTGIHNMLIRRIAASTPGGDGSD